MLGTQTKADRLRLARIAEGFKSASEAARSLGVSPPTYIHHENGTREFGEEAARLYARRYHVSFPWLFLGEGEMQPGALREEREREREEERAAREDADPEFRRQSESRWKKSAEQEKLKILEDLQLVPVITSSYTKALQVRGHWSRFINLEDRVYHEIISTWAIPKDQLYYEFGASPSASILYIVVGDSMDPTFANGDLVLVDTSHTEVYSDDIYLISEPTGNPFVRRVQRNLGSTPTTIIVSADNPNFSPQVVDLDALLVVGRVAGRFSRV